MVEWLIRGPMVWVAFLVFAGGLVWQGLLFFRSSRERPAPEPPPLPPEPKPAAKSKGLQGMVDRFSAWFDRHWARMRRTVLFTHPLMTTITIVFHTFLFAAPLFAEAHNELWRRAWGIGLPSLPFAAVDMMTLVVVLCGAVFLYRRFFVRRVRAITTPWDIVILAITVAPFLTGFLAAHHVGDYGTVVLVHIACGELMLMAIPFTKLGHMLFFFLYRLLLPSEYSFGRGSRAW